MRKADLLILTPVYFADTGGASVYYQSLVQALRWRELRVIVVSEKRAPPIPADYVGLLPAWRGSSSRFFMDRALYGLENLVYSRLFNIVRAYSPHTFLVHSSFHYLPGLFTSVLRALRSHFKEVRFVADVRDHLMPVGAIPILNTYDAIVGCSKNVVQFLLDGGVDPGRLTHIPVVQDIPEVPLSVMHRAHAAVGLTNRRYIFYAGLLKETKGMALLLDVFDRIRSTYPDVVLALAGLSKSLRPETRSRMKSRGVLLLGPQPREVVLALIRGASLCINLSPNEGLPRFSLESLALHTPTILPPDIPEFEEHCARFVARSPNPDQLAALALQLISSKECPRYPLGQHSLDNVLPLYGRVLFPAPRHPW